MEKNTHFEKVYGAAKHVCDGAFAQESTDTANIEAIAVLCCVCVDVSRGTLPQLSEITEKTNSNTNYEKMLKYNQNETWFEPFGEHSSSKTRYTPLPKPHEQTKQRQKYIVNKEISQVSQSLDRAVLRPEHAKEHAKGTSGARCRTFAMKYD